MNYYYFTSMKQLDKSPVIGSVCKDDNYIKCQSIRFQKKVVDYIIKETGLEHNLLNENSRILRGKLYTYGNSILLNSRSLQNVFGVSNDSYDYTLVVVLYKNIIYRKGEHNIAVLDLQTKQRLKKTFLHVTRTQSVSPKVLVVGRKYKCSKTGQSNQNCFGVPCWYETCAVDKFNKVEPVNEHLPESVGKTQTKLGFLPVPCAYHGNVRRKFLYNLKEALYQRDSSLDIKYINGVLQNSLFLDVEYIVDVVDSFSDFPFAEDKSMLFMAGLCHVSDLHGIVGYTNLTANELTANEEYALLDKLIGILEHACHRNGKVFVFHWSSADKIVVEKSVVKYPVLQLRYSKLLSGGMHWLDLMKVIKESMKLQSYSLKYVAKNILDYTYQSNCQNGFDAMCSVIDYYQQGVHGDARSNVMKDLIHYNEIDTQLMIEIVRKLC